MLRLDIPQVCANVIRWEAFVTFSLCWLALIVSPWMLVLLVAQSALRGFAGHHRCPAHLLWKRLFMAAGIQGRKEDAGPKMFANRLLFVASSVSLLLYASGSALWKTPCAVLIVFSFVEWTLSFCAACWVYSAWHRQFPPAQS